MGFDIIVLGAATAVVAVAQAGVVMTARAGNLRDTAYIVLPALAVVVLFVFAWLEVTGR